MTDEKLVDRIRALIAKAEGTDNQHEAAAFMGKAREMLERYNLTISDVRDRDDPMGRGQLRVPYSTSWYKMVTLEAAEYLGCAVIFSETSRINKRGRLARQLLVNVIGREGARITAEMIIPYLWQACVRAGNELGRGRTPAQKRKLIAQVGEALAHRLQRLNEEQKPSPVPGSGGQLVPIDEAKAALHEMFPETRSLRTHVGGYGQAARERAESISLAGQVQQSEQSVRRLT